MNIVHKHSKQNKEHQLIHFHKEAKMVDDRYAITEAEKKQVLSTYFKQGIEGPLDIFPSMEKRKVIVLQNIISRFERNKIYTEKEVNEILKSIYSDYVTIRRYLIEYGFMHRSKDCTTYWL